MSKILIIDDRPTVLKIMPTSLFAQGHIVKTAVSGAEGPQAARVERPQAISTSTCPTSTVSRC